MNRVSVAIYCYQYTENVCTREFLNLYLFIIYTEAHLKLEITPKIAVYQVGQEITCTSGDKSEADIRWESSSIRGIVHQSSNLKITSDMKARK